jgi:acid phosphatase
MNHKGFAPIAMALLAVGSSGCSTHRAPAHEFLQSTLWVQHAAEYDATTIQLFQIASNRLIEALADPSWTALPDDPAGERPPAVILDVDETVLDNSPYHARMILAGGTYDTESWHQWVMAAAAKPLPGAAEFLQLARAKGVAIFYVTNRREAHEGATRRNLEEVGLPVDEGDDALLMAEESGWTEDKEARRRYVARTHRVLLLLGDDLNDFVPARKITPAEREALVAQHSGRWGKQWILLPNQSYGSWEGSLLPGSRTRREQLEEKRRLLDVDGR